MLKLSRVKSLEFIRAAHDLELIEGMLDGFSHMVELNILAWPAGWGEHLARFKDVHVGMNVYLAAGDLNELETVKADWVEVTVTPIIRYKLERVGAELNFLPLIDSMLDFLDQRWATASEHPARSTEFLEELNVQWEVLGLPWEGRSYSQVYTLIVNSAQYRTIHSDVASNWGRDLTKLWLD